MSPKKAPLELYGRAVTDPMDGRTKHGAPMANFVLETIDQDSGELQTHRVTAFGSYANDINEYVHEGLDLTVRGVPNRYEKDGLIFQNVKMKTFALGDKREGEK